MSIAKTGISLGGALLALAVVGTAQTFQPFTPDIPKAWDDREVARFELPLVQRDRSPRYMTSEEYYKLTDGRFIARTRPSPRAVSRLDIWRR
jgi:hypothetical protein